MTGFIRVFFYLYHGFNGTIQFRTNPIQNFQCDIVIVI